MNMEYGYGGVYREYMPEFKVTRVLRRIGVIFLKVITYCNKENF